MNDNSFDCPFCGKSFPLIKDTFSITHIYFINGMTGRLAMLNTSQAKMNFRNEKNSVNFIMYKCPSCEKTSFEMVGIGTDFNGQPRFNIYPKNDGHINYPDFVNKYVRNDYEEAYSILKLSPKSSATLSRRIIEEVIEDFYGISKGTLFNKIKTLESKNEAANITNELNAIRQVGNIGAHFNLDANKIPNDVSTEEANLLLQVVEDIINETYVRKHDVESRKISIQQLADKFKNKKQ
ncbi:DUF4145 domain-containing protein [Apilactobacillus timberlakei]|uniref:DUF4145 domain-containing protein n=1 Tax=Apilactobacillus timberlakei TaxID=2008380 RepID=UPI00112EB56A|nr:DUF4145 domain-containing protein [Apilactobacillus timberlakei]TPR12260.1 DUF4145 domain-containing protein [Apilactobacillus timberlakei]